jgi:ABC-type transporter lipoprotein component MlaA
MPLFKIIVLLLLINYNPILAEDDFGEDDLKPTRTVTFFETKLTKKISIFSIKVFKKIDKFLLSPASSVYNFLSTRNFQQSTSNSLKNYNSLLDIPNNIIILNADRTFTSVGNALLNSSIGLLGTANFSKEFELKEANTQIADVLRFYGMPEVFFIVFFLPFSMPDVAEIGIKSLRNGQLNTPKLGFFADFGFNLVNTRTLQPKLFDAMQNLDEELLYNTYKDIKYNNAKYWYIEKNVYQAKTLSLKEKFRDTEKEFLN